jgi:hypothetical protein
MRTTCKHCHKTFRPIRAGAQFCSGRCRTAAYRDRQKPPPFVQWEAEAPELPTISRTRNADGTRAMSKDKLGERLLEIAEHGDDGEPKTGRRYYYLALSYGYIKPDMSDTKEGAKSRNAAYKRITDVLGTLRLQGRLGWDMVLDLTRELDEWLIYGSPREAKAALRQSYDEDRWQGQSFYPILIVEKDTLEPVCKPMAMKWQMPFASSRGYGSLTLQHDVAKVLKRRYAKTGQHAIVYFVSDLDPSGLDLQRSWEEALDGFDVHYSIERIGLTRDQVRDNRDVRGRPLDSLSIEVKEGDTRADSYRDQYGDRCWEADVLPASVIEEALDADIRSWRDRKLWERREREIEQARKLL